MKESGIDEILWYQNMISELKLCYKDREIDYDKRVPQGSILSPILLALIYDTVLSEAAKNHWKIWAYADDVAIGVTTQEEYNRAVSWLDTWKLKMNMDLEIFVYRTRLKVSAGMRLKQILEKIRIKSDKIRFINKSASRFIYATDVVLGLVSSENADFLKSPRKSYCSLRSVSNKLLLEYILEKKSLRF